MELRLTPLEARLIGCLIEKEITTPDLYPLSLNALTNACNQKSNRDPVLDLDEAAVQRTLDELMKRHLVSEKSGFGSRVLKYAHRLCNSEFGRLHFDERELGVMCELLLRGPQTPGELRTHTQRLCRFSDVEQVEATLQRLADREDGPFVVRLAREPGRRESRYAHLLGGEVSGAATEAEEIPATERAPAPPERTAAPDRMAVLERRVDSLEGELAELRATLARLTEALGGA